MTMSGRDGASPLQRAAGGAGGSGKRVLVLVGGLVVGLGIPGYYMLSMLNGQAKADEGTTPVRESYSGEALGRGSDWAEPPPKAEEGPPAEEQKEEEAELEEQIVEAEEPKGVDWAYLRELSEGSTIVVAAAPAPERQGTGPPSGPKLRHIPRGTIFPAFLHSRVISDNLDSRVRAVLLEDYALGDDIILPAGGLFHGTVMAVDYRYQKRIAVKIFNYVYPDGEAEIEFTALMLNPDESSHLMADDVRHHTGKLITGLVALEGLRAAAGALAGGTGNDVTVAFGGGMGSGAQDLLEPKLQSILDIPPTLTVERGKRVYVMVDASIDVPEFRDVQRGYSPTSWGAPGESSTPVELQELMKTLETMRASLPQMPPGGGALPSHLMNAPPPGGGRLPGFPGSMP